MDTTYGKPNLSSPAHCNPNGRTSEAQSNALNSPGIAQTTNTSAPFPTVATQVSTPGYTTQRQLQPHFVRPASCSSSHRLVLEEEGRTAAVKNPTSPVLMQPIDICPRRLIDTSTLQLVEFAENVVIPPYAILSHRWIKGEVVYAEFLRPQKQTFSKSGYKKIQAACQQARQDDIHYIWVDTCCIKQGDHQDVAANITSMYAYYQNADVCYAYLVDAKNRREVFGRRVFLKMHSSRKMFDGKIPLAMKGGSEWFWRGWTLQELLAPRPRAVIFFNKRWERVGDKHELRDDICQQTTVPLAILSSEQSIQDVDILTRMSWAVRRKTTKHQDEAYCLQGLLGVSVEPDYNEDWQTSYNRLGKALFDAQPELKERLGISDDLLSDPRSRSLYNLLQQKFLGTWGRELKPGQFWG
ncbi:hypothetical protein VKT23_017282 [Stygiomarasmius scandens]|uniref:Heterokaryon incompatibility domain-containing protein n=1 Tax=Marasmiellus scandens TaxID=2682957 RepID=A0ABR1IVW1_9AGAR